MNQQDGKAKYYANYALEIFKKKERMKRKTTSVAVKLRTCLLTAILWTSDDLAMESLAR